MPFYCLLRRATALYVKVNDTVHEAWSSAEAVLHSLKEKCVLFDSVLVIQLKLH